MSDIADIPLAVLQQYFRVPVGPLPVDYVGRPPLLGSAVTNLSTTGVFIATPKPLAVGTPVAIAFTLPGTGPTSGPVRAETVVRWRSTDAPVPPPTPAGMGLSFTSLATPDRRRVERYVAAFLARTRA